MFLLVGEQLKQRESSAGEHHCGVCRGDTPFASVEEQNYFSLFSIPLIPLEKTAEYLRCERCGNAFSSRDTSQPSSIELGQWALTYIMLGYGMFDYQVTAREIFERVTGFAYSEENLKAHIRALESENLSMMELLQQLAGTTNLAGKQQILSLAYLMTYMSCEVQYEDRLRLNLMGNALGVSIGFVEAVIQAVRAEQYYGVRRLLKADVTS